MEIVLHILQVFVAVGLVGVVLLQRSEGGGLGIGSSGGAGSFMSVRGTANLLTRTTAILGAVFMASSLGLALLANPQQAQRSIFDTQNPSSTNQAPPVAPAPGQAQPGTQPAQPAAETKPVQPDAGQAAAPPPIAPTVAPQPTAPITPQSMTAPSPAAPIAPAETAPNKPKHKHGAAAPSGQ